MVVITPEGDIPEGQEPIVVPEKTTVCKNLRQNDRSGWKPSSGEIEFTTRINDGVYRDVAVADENGYYEINLPVSDSYNVIVNKEAYMLYTEEIPFGSAEDTTHIITLQELEPEKVFAFQNILFEFDSAVLKTESFAVLDEIVLTLLNNTWLKLDIAGHTCNMGSDAYNLKLSKERAASVYEYLTSKGIEAQRLTHTGFGEAHPLNDNATIAKRQQNRRVEFIVKKQ